MNSLINAIEHLYQVFGKYTTEGIEHCPCGCIKEEDVAKLNSKPLRELEEKDLVSYHGSALYTWGDIEHYKHYLPRILELRAMNRNYAFIDLGEVFTKLDYAKWLEWDADEITALLNYVLADWIEFANNEESEIRDSELEAYSKFFELRDLIKLWDIANAPAALKNFVLFFYYHGNQILGKGYKLNEKEHKADLALLIHSSQLTKKLEADFFKYEHTDAEYADKVSVVLQMIEQELRAEAASGS